MATEVMLLKSYSHLKNELEEARTNLKNVDDSIKRLLGRVPGNDSRQPPIRRQNSSQKRHADGDDTQPLKKRFNSFINRPNNEEDEEEAPPVKSTGLISKIVAAPIREIPKREDALEKQNKDNAKFKDRNRRMFGSILSTLIKFQQEETKLKVKEEKRTRIEQKIERNEQREKEEIKKERQELFLNRKKKQKQIKAIELKMYRMKEYTVWEEFEKQKIGFIRTKAKPSIFYLPRRINDKSKALIEDTKQMIEENIEKKKQCIIEELNEIEEKISTDRTDKFEQTNSKRNNSTNDNASFDNDENVEENLENEANAAVLEPEKIVDETEVNNQIEEQHVETA